MKNEHLILISLRIDPNVLSHIDKLAIKHTYWRRNNIINNLLDTIFSCFEEEAIYDMIRRRYHQNTQVEASFKINPIYKEQELSDNADKLIAFLSDDT